VRLEGAYVFHRPADADPEQHDYLVPHRPERTSPHWKWHPLDHHVTIAHRPGNIGSSDYSDVGMPKEGMTGGRTFYHASDNEYPSGHQLTGGHRLDERRWQLEAPPGRHGAALHQAAGSGMMVALVPSDEVLDHLQQVMEPLKHETEARDEMHVTVLYLGKETDHTQAELDKLPELIRLWAKTAEPFEASVQGSGTFANSGEHPLIALVDIPGEARHMHKSLSDFLKGHGISFPENHSWIPHVTLAYSPHAVRFMPKVERHSWPVNEVHYARNRNWTAIPLGRG
jgi:2'-5' RNA ligase